MMEYGATFSIFIPDTTFGIGAIDNLGALAKSLGSRKPLVITDKGIISAGLLDKAKASLEKTGIPFALFDGCLPDAPLSVIQKCSRVARDGNHDLLIALGGGSVMDTVKVAGVFATADKELRYYVGMHKVERPGLPTLLIPTTAGTSAEWTWVAVVTDDLDPGRVAKKSMYSTFLRPRAVIVDPLMTLNLSPRATAETGIDTLSHAIEAHTTWKANLVSDMFTEKVISLVAQNLRSAYGKGSKNMEARCNMAIGASLGFAYMVSGAGIIHGMGYPLQMKTHISHGESMAILMPPVMEFNLVAHVPRFARIAELMGETVPELSLRAKAQRSVEAVRQLIQDVRMPLRMRDVGVQKEDIPGFVEAVFTNSPHLIDGNCRHVTREEMAEIYEAAW